MSKVKIKCQEANQICDKTQYNEASFFEKIKLTIHLLYCKACKKYTKRNTQLTRLIKNPKVKTLEASQKANIKDIFDEELKNQN